MTHLCRRLFGEESGQDIIEYALLALLIGVVGVFTWRAIATTIGVNYQSYDSGVQGVWEPPDPGAGSP